MKLFHRTEKGNCIISIVGNLALMESNDLKTYIQPIIDDSSINNIVLNCKNVEIIDSRGVGLLAAILKDLEDKQKGFMLCHLNQATFGILQSLQLDKIIRIKNTEEEALTELGV